MPVRRLDPILVDQIAAGEVIERPAAAVKELVENALDAGATQIAVEIEQGGRALIRVTDNGCGMGRDDLLLSVERHATSKLPDGDLTTIRSLGFRGEALPSIAAVSQLEITTRPAGAEQALMLRVIAGRMEEPRPAAFAKGTRIEVRDLFFATPARLKFLKTDRSEAQAIAQVLRRLAMAHPAVRFQFTGEGAASFDLPREAADHDGRLRRLAAILGREFENNALPVEAVREGFAVMGFAGLPTFHRATAQDQFLFVNGRPVKDRLLLGATRAAYQDFMPRDRHPMLALFIEVDPSEVDVNVHPAKTEVRFRDAGLVRALLISALRQALTSSGERATDTNTERALSMLATSTAGLPSRPSAPTDWRQSWAAPSGAMTPARAPVQSSIPGFADALQAAYAAPPPSEPTGDFPLGAAKAQVHATYIIAQTSDGLVIVDQHAAHERLVYEKLKRQRAENGIARQLLLVPEVIEMDADRAETLVSAAAQLSELGLGIEGFGPGAIILREVPAAIAGGNIRQLVMDIADHVAEWGGPLALEKAVDHVLATFACHHSIRAGRQLRPEEMNALLREIEATPGSGQCNHGRPTSVTLKLADIERLFGRR
jgi:DNA mismatch repair protein MutL